MVVQEDIMTSAISVTASQLLFKTSIMGIVMQRKEFEVEINFVVFDFFLVVCECLKGVPITGPEQISEKMKFSIVKSVKEEEIGSKTVLGFECEEVKTIILRGVTKTTLGICSIYSSSYF